MTQQQELADHHPAKTVTIIVNGRPREVTKHQLTYMEIVQLAFPGETPTDQTVFTVTYSNPHGKDGSLVTGGHVIARDGEIFNVDRTDKS